MTRRICALALVLAGCLDPLPEATDFTGADRTGTCRAGQLWCDGGCVPSDVQNCGACGAACGTVAPDICHAGECHGCVIEAANRYASAPVAGPGEVPFELACPRMPMHSLVRISFSGNVNAHHWVRACRPIESQCVRWQLEIDAGDPVAFVHEACNTEPTGAPYPFVQQVDNVPVAPDGQVRVRVRALDGKADGCPTKIRFSLGTVLEITRSGGVEGPRWRAP